jgi:hypothetical protein
MMDDGDDGILDGIACVVCRVCECAMAGPMAMDAWTPSPDERQQRERQSHNPA